MIKRASVRVGLLDRSTGRLLNLGSGTIVDNGPHAPRNQVLTAAHLFIDVDAAVPTTFGVQAPNSYYLWPLWCTHNHSVGMDWLDEAAPVIIAIGMFQADQLPSRWCYWAELVTPLETLQTMVASPDAPHTPNQLCDLAVLRIRGRLSMTPELFQSSAHTTRHIVTTKHSTEDTLAGGETQLPPGVPLSDPAVLTSNRDTITVFGWFSPRGTEDTLHVPQPMAIMTISQGLLISEVRLDSAGSGGGTCDHDGHLVAVNSCSLSGNRTALRMVSWLTFAHGLLPTAP